MKLSIEYLENTAAVFGDKDVIKEPGKSMTYQELLHNAKKIGWNLNKRLSGEKNKPIAIFIDKGCECLSAIFGVLYSGNCYVPMDIKTPKERFDSIIKTMESKVVICTEKTSLLIKKNQIECEALIYEDLSDVSECETEMETILKSIREKTVDTDLMYILFTSGSTGTPKGVAITHRALDDYIQALLSSVPIDSTDVVGNQVPFYVDMSLKDIYMSIAVGASIVTIPQTYFMSPKKLLTYLNESGVTTLMWVPTAYGIVTRFDGLTHIRPNSLKKFLFSGESMPISVLRYWMQSYPTAVWIQLYGPTEITGACTYFIVDRLYEEGETVPIGKPFPNTGIILLDETNREIKSNSANEPGEICVYGSCLAAGYYNNPEKTAEAFVQNPLINTYPSLMYCTGDIAKWDDNRNLIFVSRKDHQIKHGGRRIELGEIETAVDSIDEIKASCCVHESSTDTIVLFYEGNLLEDEVKSRLKKKLPQYMIPGKLICMDYLPTLSNGKLDRKRMETAAKGMCK